MGLNKKSVDDINVKGLKVLCRCDFNVPLKDGKITDENRLVAALPTIKKLIADGGKVILCSHLGKVKTEEDYTTKTLAPVAARLSELLGQEVKFAADREVVGPNAKAAVEAMKDFLRRIGEYQCAALKGRGQSYGIKAIKRWMRNKDIRYAGQCDISKCYPSIDRNKLMEFLRKYIKNEPLLELIAMLIMTFDTGLSIGSYLSQYLCNLFLSQIYHEIAENMYRIRKKRNGTIERVNLVKHQLFFMDDILILGTNAKDIHKAMKLIIQKADEMGLKIKDSWMVYTTIAKRKDDGHFIDIMGVRIYRQHITIRRRVFLRVRRSYKKAQSLVKQRKKIPVWLARKCMSYKGILDHTDSYNIKRRYNANKTIQICKGVISHESKIRHYTRECYC